MVRRAYLKEALKDSLTPTQVALISSGLDIIGDIAIIRVPETLSKSKEKIGVKLIEKMKNIKTVLSQTSPVEGNYRIRRLEFLAGEKKTATLHKEYGCLFKVDLSKTYFSPRLSYERLRIASQVTADEVVINMFAGAAPFSILIAKIQPRVKVYSIDVNPSSHRLAMENIRLNKVIDRVEAIQGDARDVILKSLKEVGNRILMPLPEQSLEYLDSAVSALTPQGGIIHLYTHLHADKDENGVAKAEQLALSKLNASAEVITGRVVKEVGPRWRQIVLDIKVKK